VTHHHHCALLDREILVNRRSFLPLLTTTPLLGWAMHRVSLGQEASHSLHAGRFQVSNGQILDPKGTVWKAHGINIPFMSFGGPAIETGHVVSNAACQPLTSTFPGVNFVRFLTFWSLDQLPYCSALAMAPYIDRLTSAGITTLIAPQYYPTILSGHDLDNVCKWYTSIASYYKDNPYVWLETQNEPSKVAGGYGSPDGEITRIYAAIRHTGNMCPIGLCPFGGVNLTHMNPSSYLPGFTNVFWDIHFYGWVPNYVADQTAVNNALLNQIAAFNGTRSADGVIPVIIAEFGPATGGVGEHSTGFFGSEGMWYDNNWQQVLQAVYTLGMNYSGWAQFYWNTAGMTPAPHTKWIDGTLLAPFNGTALTRPGQMLKDALAAYV
jgi:hypothetical protein